MRTELFEDRVYALTPKGEVIDLPRGATPLDFAYSVHTSLGHRCRGAKVNGRIVPLAHALSNGEIVEIITGKQDAPSRDWMAPEQGYLVSARNRAKVRAWFRKQDVGDNRSAGRAIVERELARAGAKPEQFAALVQELRARDADHLYQLLQAAMAIAEVPLKQTHFRSELGRREVLDEDGMSVVVPYVPLFLIFRFARFPTATPPVRSSPSPDLELGPARTFS